jgi:hypothetical protein
LTKVAQEAGFRRQTFFLCVIDQNYKQYTQQKVHLSHPRSEKTAYAQISRGSGSLCSQSSISVAFSIVATLGFFVLVAGTLMIYSKSLTLLKFAAEAAEAYETLTFVAVNWLAATPVKAALVASFPLVSFSSGGCSVPFLTSYFESLVIFSWHYRVYLTCVFRLF